MPKMQVKLRSRGKKTCCGEEKEFRPINFNFISLFLNWYFNWNAASWFFLSCLCMFIPTYRNKYFQLNARFQLELIWMSYEKKVHNTHAQGNNIGMWCDALKELRSDCNEIWTLREKEKLTDNSDYLCE